MTNGATLRLVLLVSCHALVHFYELSLPSVELEIAREYVPNDVQGGGKAMTGRLSTYWRLPWGLGALAAGWLVDRFGGKRMLAVFLLGCSGVCAVVGFGIPVPALFAAMFGMGAFACIYHPAGLALISHRTSIGDRPRALGIHGVFGSIGIAMAPFLAGIVTVLGWTWRHYYWMLAGAGAALGLLFALKACRGEEDSPTRASDAERTGQQRGAWRSYFTLTLLAVMQGFIYSGVLSFLTRYISGWLGGSPDSQRFGLDSCLTAGVLLAGCIGQYVSGRIAKPALLEKQLTLVMFANAPFLLWMAFAEHWDRIMAAGLFSIVHFMHQPLYNSLIAKYTPRRRRSLCYGFSFAMGLGLGSFGATFAGRSPEDVITYGVLAAVALGAGGLGLVLWSWNRSEPMRMG